MKQVPQPSRVAPIGSMRLIWRAVYSTAFAFVLSLALLAADPAWATVPPEAPGAAACESLLVSADPSGKTTFFNDLATVIETNRAEIKQILMKVDSPNGAEYEIHQALKTLRGAPLFELKQLARTRTLENVAVYGSTNIPLYTLVLHAFIPATVSKNIWFRTPQVSREVYVELFNFIRTKINAPERLSGVHVLHLPKDVQYDNFRKAHVLGLHKKGKRFERPPSEIVIFTGNPKTGREVFATNYTKMQELGGPGARFEQVFMMFGAGMNPMIVTADAAPSLPEAVDRIIEPIRINSSQDCIAPTFYAVSSNVKEALLAKLLPELGKLKLATSRDDATADYFPLVFSESVSPLLAYRLKYQDYLVTPNAKIDTRTKAVEPHVFVFPIEMWGRVELEQHYAPFIVMFEYSKPGQIAQMARDPRVAERAMFASIFGAHGKPETEAAIKAFRASNHDVRLNNDFFAEENGNLPFGGQGPDASSVLRVSTDENGQPKIQESSKPLLFSKEAAEHYPAGETLLP